MRLVLKLQLVKNQQLSFIIAWRRNCFEF
jgi:hypothetical protein